MATGSLPSSSSDPGGPFPTTPSSSPDDKPTETPPPEEETSSEDTPSPTTTPSPTSSEEEPSETPTPTPTPTSSEEEQTSEEPTPTPPSSSDEYATTITRTSTKLPTNAPTPPASSPLDPNVTSSTLPTASSTGEAAAGGLSAGGTIAVAVVVPVVSVGLIIIALLFWWRKRKATKLAEEERKQEIEEYQFNPNNDPTLPSVGGASYDGDGGNTGGYRGWGTTSTSRRAGTNPSSGSNGGYPRELSPVDDGFYYPDDNQRQGLGHTETVGALPTAMPAASSQNRAADIQRGPSNASSAYSTGNHSDLSDDVMQGGGIRGEPYYDESQYYDDGGHLSQPVIRDVQARRNTRIESPSVVPHQGNAGISQNF